MGTLTCFPKAAHALIVRYLEHLVDTCCSWHSKLMLFWETMSDEVRCLHNEAVDRVLQRIAARHAQVCVGIATDLLDL